MLTSKIGNIATMSLPLMSKVWIIYAAPLPTAAWLLTVKSKKGQDMRLLYPQ